MEQLNDFSLAKLLDSGVSAESSIKYGVIRMRGLDREAAFALLYLVTKKIDENYGSTRSSSFTTEQIEWDYEHFADSNRSLEYRPADRNCAVRIEEDTKDTYELIADTRNDFDDHTELGGKELLRRSFLEVLEDIDRPDVES